MRIAHQMPVAWDGHPVTWTPWEPAPTLCMNIGLYDDVGNPLGTTMPCDHCHLHTDRYTCRGTLDNRVGNIIRIPGTGVLSATRCGLCGGTSVYNLDTNQAWDLDESDYGPTGSWEAADE